jgi:glycosyltransferase involved in cell wall biosynthesis
MTARDYALITPARNEGRHIGRLIRCVVAQTVRPVKWVIVSDGSTDDTEEIVRSHQRHDPFIDLVRKESGEGRDFRSKVGAVELGLSRLRELDYRFIGNLDADASFEPDYYETVLGHFHRDPQLGIAAGATVDVMDGARRPTLSSGDSVGGIAQFFRRECWEDIGGYRPLKLGGEDSAAEIMARMKGWKVRKLPGLEVRHHRQMGTGSWGGWNRRFYQGRHFYSLGHHPLFFALKCLYRLGERPYVAGSVLLWAGYAYGFFKKERARTPPELVQFLQAEQMKKLSSLVLIRNRQKPSIKIGSV